ncbi:unnamed protein product [Nyctereutes procyonoides]|uniref:(raccoon dog) hypothetical protein n=1 Tax=Nyctereutes procyonoides TaxID=34880 RepID=A0A811Z656_NYCPR|nr:unnamed protein product [Nyctereutes procyonoides]
MQSQERDIGYFDNFKANSRNVTDSMTFATKSIQTTIIGYKGCDLFAVLDQLDPDALPDGRIWLLGFNPPGTQAAQHRELPSLETLPHDSLRVGSAPEGVGLQRRAQVGLLVLLIMPLLVPPVAAELPGGTEAAALACERSPG